MKPSNLMRKFLEHRDGVLGFLLALTHDRDAAEEIFQEVGIAVMEEASRRTSIENFTAWIHEVARRRAAEHFRKHSRRNALEHAAGLDEAVALAFQEHAADPADLARGQQHLEECLEELPAPQRQLIERRYRDHAPMRDIARTADSTEGSVKVLLWRIRRQLARCIEGKRTAVGEGR